MNKKKRNAHNARIHKNIQTNDDDDDDEDVKQTLHASLKYLVISLELLPGLTHTEEWYFVEIQKMMRSFYSQNGLAYLF